MYAWYFCESILFFQSEFASFYIALEFWTTVMLPKQPNLKANLCFYVLTLCMQLVGHESFCEKVRSWEQKAPSHSNNWQSEF